MRLRLNWNQLTEGVRLLLSLAPPEFVVPFRDEMRTMPTHPAMALFQGKKSRFAMPVEIVKGKLSLKNSYLAGRAFLRAVKRSKK